LDQKFVSPRFQIFEGLGNIDVVNQNAAIGTSVESDAQRLEAFLTSSIPNLQNTKHDQFCLVPKINLEQPISTGISKARNANYMLEKNYSSNKKTKQKIPVDRPAAELNCC
jgi:hypothetical protein